MLVITTKLTRKKVVAGVLLAGFLLCGVIVLVADSGNTRASNAEAVIAAETSKPEKLKTAEDRVLLLQAYGWEVEKEPVEFMEVQIPKEFDATYAQYNEIQKEQGFDLQKYAGKHVMKYSYCVQNHPSGEAKVIATILVYKNKLIGGDVASAQLDGFIHGLQKSE